MNYIDTNVIIAYINERDINHHRAAKAMDELREFVTSQVAVLELKSVLSRTTKLNENEIQAYADYLKFINIDVLESDMNTVFKNASEISYKIKMKTLDILHVSASLVINAYTFVTLDTEFMAKKREMSDIGLEVLSP